MEEKSVKIGCSAGKKINLGNYESYDINLWEERQIDEGSAKEMRDKLFRKLMSEVEVWENAVKGLGEKPKEQRMRKIVLNIGHLETLRKGDSLVFPNKNVEITVGE